MKKEDIDKKIGDIRGGTEIFNSSQKVVAKERTLQGALVRYRLG